MSPKGKTHWRCLRNFDNQHCNTFNNSHNENIYCDDSGSERSFYTNAQLPEVSIEDLCEKWAFYPERPDVLSSTPDGNSYTIISPDGKSIEQYSYSTGKKESTIVDLTKVKGDNKLDRISGYELSSTGDFIIVWGNVESIYRRSYTADHYVIDVAHNEIFPLSETGAEQEAAFAPNGFIISYVKNNDIHLMKLKYRSTSDVTTDGEKNKIINGIPDWVNEEEFATARSYAWSPDSKQIAYIKYDETEVPEFSFPIYAASHPRHEEAALYLAHIHTSTPRQVRKTPRSPSMSLTSTVARRSK